MTSASTPVTATDIAPPAAQISVLRSAEQQLERHWWIVITLLLIAAVGVRVLALRNYYPSMDEQWHLHLSNGFGTLASRLPEQTLMAPPPDVTAMDRAAPLW